MMSDNPRSTSLPAAAGRGKREVDTVAFAGAGASVAATRATLMLPTKNLRMTQSESATKVRDHLNGVEHRFRARVDSRRYSEYASSPGTEEKLRTTPKPSTAPEPTTQEPTTQKPSTQEPTASTATETANVPYSGQEETELSEDSLSQNGAETCLPGPGAMPAQTEKVEWSRKQAAVPTSRLGMPGKLMELIEDRDRAVHLCLQVLYYLLTHF